MFKHQQISFLSLQEVALKQKPKLGKLSSWGSWARAVLCIWHSPGCTVVPSPQTQTLPLAAPGPPGAWPSSSPVPAFPSAPHPADTQSLLCRKLYIMYASNMWSHFPSCTFWEFKLFKISWNYACYSKFPSWCLSANPQCEVGGFF